MVKSWYAQVSQINYRERLRGMLLVLIACLIEDHMLTFQNYIFWKAKTHTIIKACSLLGVLDDERHFFEIMKKVEKVLHDQRYEILIG